MAFSARTQSEPIGNDSTVTVKVCESAETVKVKAGSVVIVVDCTGSPRETDAMQVWGTYRGYPNPDLDVHVHATVGYFKPRSKRTRR